MSLSGVPSHWKLVRLADLFEAQLGKMVSAKSRAGISPKPYLRNLNVQWGLVDTRDVIEMDFNAREMNKFRLRAGDLVMCEGGVPGRTAIWRDDLAECYYQKAIHRLRPLDGRALPEFFLYWFRYAFDITNFYSIAGASSTIAHLPAAQLKSLSLPVPPLDEQRQIAAMLSAVQRAIERQERLIALTAELKKALMHKLFTEGTRGEPQKQTEIGRVPLSWTGTTLGQLCKKPDGRIQTGPFGSILHKREYQNTGTPIVNPVYLIDNRIDHTDVPRIGDEAAERLRRYRLKENDLLFARRGDIGRHGIVSNDETGWFCGTGCFIVRISDPRIDARFLNAFVSKDEVVAWLERHAAGVIMPNLSNNVLERMPIYFPPLPDQQAMVGILSSAGEKASIHARTAGALRALFRTLLHQLMTAQVRVHDLDLSALQAGQHAGPRNGRQTRQA